MAGACCSLLLVGLWGPRTLLQGLLFVPCGRAVREGRVLAKVKLEFTFGLAPECRSISEEVFS